MLSWAFRRGPSSVRAGAALIAALASQGCGDAELAVIARAPSQPAHKIPTKTPIKHLVVIFGENISFDHYFGTYPRAANLDGETPFVPSPDTPAVNNLITPLDPANGFKPIIGLDLMGSNPNFTNAANEPDQANPFRLPPEQAVTPSMVHAYQSEQLAANGGAMDLFPYYTGTAGTIYTEAGPITTKGLVMAHFDGNTLNALWNYAQQFALNDNSWSSTFGPSTPGAINLISGQTNGVTQGATDIALMATLTSDGNGGFTVIDDPKPLGDLCSLSGEQILLAGRNIGDLLNARSISWGWFQGGFDLEMAGVDGTRGCGRWSAQTVGPMTASADYVPHHQPFQYYVSTRNPTHARPSSVGAIGSTLTAQGEVDPANHQYDIHDFFDALAAGYLPAVSYLKAAAFQDGHSSNSNPIDEQDFIIQVVRAVQARPEWESTAIILAYDDSDGWYDHQGPPIVNPSGSGKDALNGDGVCVSGVQQGEGLPAPLFGVDGKPAQGRCGYGTRQPLLLISPLAKKNYVDHTLTDQTSILRFVEDNWLDGERIQPGGSFDTIAGTIENMFAF